MPLPEFELSALELEHLADAELAAVAATARVAVGGDDFLLRLCVGEKGNPRLFFRLDAPDTPIICVLDPQRASAKNLVELLRAGDCVPPSLFDEIRFSQWQFELPELMWALLADWNWQRLFEVDTLQQDRFRLRVEGSVANWCCTHYDPRSNDVLYLAARAHRNARPNSPSKTQIVSTIDVWMRQQMSDVARAYVLSSLPEEEHVPFLTRFENGNWKQYEQLLRYLSWNDYEIWQGRHPNEINLIFKGLSSERNQVKREYIWIFHGLSVPEATMPDAMKPALRALDSYFSPVINSDWENTTVGFLMRRHGSFPYALALNSPVSAHQRLEAKLVLREFFSDKLTSTELAELMGEH